MNDRVEKRKKQARKPISQSKLNEFILRQQEGRAYSKITKVAEKSRAHHKKLDKEKDPLVAYCHTAFEHGFSRQVITKRLYDAGHSRWEVRNIIKKASKDVKQFAHPETRKYAKNPWSLKDNMTIERFFVVNIIVLGLLLLGLMSPFLKQTGLTSGSDDCDGIELDLIYLRGENQLCHVEEGDSIIVKFMIRNEGVSLSGYDIIFGGSERDNRFNFPEHVKAKGVIIHALEYDKEIYGELKSFELVPYSIEGQIRRCSAEGLYYPGIPRCP